MTHTHMIMLQAQEWTGEREREGEAEAAKIDTSQTNSFWNGRQFKTGIKNICLVSTPSKILSLKKEAATTLVRSQQSSNRDVKEITTKDFFIGMKFIVLEKGVESKLLVCATFEIKLWQHLSLLDFWILFWTVLKRGAATIMGNHTHPVTHTQPRHDSLTLTHSHAHPHTLSPSHPHTNTRWQTWTHTRTHTHPSSY